MKTAIITGASVGIGCATAQAFLDEGFAVYNLARRECPIKAVTNLACDLASARSIDGTITILEEALAGSTEIALVHNASQMRKDSADDCDSESLEQVLATNVVAINSLNQRLLPLMPASSSVSRTAASLSVGHLSSRRAVGSASSSFAHACSARPLTLARLPMQPKVTNPLLPEGGGATAGDATGGAKHQKVSGSRSRRSA